MLCVRISQASLAVWSRKLDHQRAEIIMSLAVLGHQDISKWRHQSRHKSSIRDASATFKCFGPTVRMAGIRGMEGFCFLPLHAHLYSTISFLLSVLGKTFPAETSDQRWEFQSLHLYHVLSCFCYVRDNVDFTRNDAFQP